VLNFSKINILIIYFIFFVLALFSLLNFQKSNQLIDKKINLGLDLQGGSYLLLEINSDTLVQEKIQDKVIPIKRLLKDNNIKYSNFKINNQTLSVNILILINLIYYFIQEKIIR
jgi:preprotein translocase subunit SecD